MVVGESLCEVKERRICCGFLSFVCMRFAAIYFFEKNLREKNLRELFARLSSARELSR